MHMSQGHLLIDEVDVDLDVHHAAMMDGNDRVERLVMCRNSVIDEDVRTMSSTYSRK